MSTLLLMKFDNYFNRIIKRYETVSEYLQNAENSSYLININFNPNDDVNTTQIINWVNSWTPDYLLVLENDSSAVPTIISSRWFITDSVRTRGKQYNITLKRDVIADYYTDINTSTLMINRCNLDSSNPLIYNSEGLKFNQIKKTERPIYDTTRCPWIVGYISTNHAAKTITVATSDAYDISQSSMSHSEWEYFSKVGSMVGEATITNTMALCYHQASGDNWYRQIWQ